MYTVC